MLYNCNEVENARLVQTFPLKREEHPEPTSKTNPAQASVGRRIKYTVIKPNNGAVSNNGDAVKALGVIFACFAILAVLTIAIQANQGKATWLQDGLKNPLITGVTGFSAISAIGGFFTLHNHVKTTDTFLRGREPKTFLPEDLDDHKKLIIGLVAIVSMVGVGLLINTALKNGSNSVSKLMNYSVNWLKDGVNSILNDPLATAITGSIVSAIFWRKIYVSNNNRILVGTPRAYTKLKNSLAHMF